MINEELTVIIESENNIHYYPYFTPKEMSDLGVFNETANKYSNIQDEAIEWFYDYRDNLRNPDSENWLKEVQYRYDNYIKESSMDNKQLLLNLGWNPEIEPTLENVLKASELTKKKLYNNENINESYIIEEDIDKIDQDKEQIYLTENLMFSKHDLYYNFEKFENGESNILLATGLSGSGKSTIASQLAKKYKANHIELDCFEHCYSISEKSLKKEESFLYEYLSTHKKLWDNLNERRISGKELGAEIYKYIKWLLPRCKKDKNNKYIIEGKQFYDLYSGKELNSYPMIIKGTSTVKSFIRIYKRKFNNDPKDAISYIKKAPTVLRWLYDDEKKLSEFISGIQINESYIEETDKSLAALLDMNKKLNEYSYGYISNSKVCKRFNPEKYISMSIMEFQKHKIGLCWDYCRYQEKYLKSFYPNTQNYYLEMDNEDGASHTITIVKIGDTFYYTESSDKRNTGVYQANDINDIFSKVIDSMHTAYWVKNNKYNVNIYKYSDPGPGIKSDEFIEICKSGSRVNYKYKKDRNINKVSSDNISESSEIKRSQLSDDVFGIPSLRKYPMHDRKHVLSAIKFFNHVEPKYEKELANNIKKKMKKYKISSDHVGNKNRLKKYL